MQSVNSPTNKDPMNNHKFAVSLSSAGIVFDKQVLHIPCELSDLISILGKPERKWVGESDIHIWDELGIFSYCFTYKTVVETVAFALGKEDQKFWPSMCFSGRLLVDGRGISANSDIEILSEIGFQQSEIIDIYWDKVYGETAVVAVTDDDVKRILSIDFTYKVKLPD